MTATTTLLATLALLTGGSLDAHREPSEEPAHHLHHAICAEAQWIPRPFCSFKTDMTTRDSGDRPS